MSASAWLGSGVELRADDGLLVDEVRGQQVALNPTAAFILWRLEQQPVNVCVDEIASQLGVSRSRVASDVDSLCRRLNSRALLNLRHYGLRYYFQWLLASLTMLRRGVIPKGMPVLVRRHRIDTTNAGTTVVTTLSAGVVTTAVFGAILGILLMGALVATTGRVSGHFEVGFSLLVGFSVGLSILLHELGHALALVGVPTVMITRGYRIMLLHRSVQNMRSRLVAASGPVFAAILGFMLIAIINWSLAVLLLPLAISLVVQPLGLTVLAEDGKHLVGLRSRTGRWLREQS